MIAAIDLAKAGRCVVCGVRVQAGETCDSVCERAKAGGRRRDEQIEEDVFEVKAAERGRKRGK